VCHLSFNQEINLIIHQQRMHSVVCLYN
jgi:hypothetical protein